MTIGRAVVTSLAVLPFTFSCPLPAAAGPLQTAAHPTAPVPDPFAVARTRVARLRQTASQLRLLADQPIPGNLPGNGRRRFARHEQWLRQAQRRVTALADQWEDQLERLNRKNARAPATDLNVFFAECSAALQTKLQRESLAQNDGSESTRASAATARLVIGNMR